MLEFIFILHKINRFLGTSSGELFKRLSELILITFAFYMVASEWLRTKSNHLKYLLIAFGSLAIQRLIAVLFLAYHIFTGTIVPQFIDPLTLTENFLELGALVLISSAFLYSVHKKHGISLRKKTYYELGALATLFIILACVAFGFIPFLPFGIKRIIIYSSLEIAKCAILYFPIYIFWKKDELLPNLNVALAFTVYSIAPALRFFNLIFYSGMNIDLNVLAHPFPFIAIALFTRSLYLKLVDKATLQEELSSTRQRYIREKEISTMKDEFVSTVSHELRTPLTSIKLYLSLLLQGKFGALNDKQKETITMIEKEGVRLTKLINDVLDLSRYEKNKEKLNLSKTNLFNLVESCIYPHLTEQKPIRIINTIPKNAEIIVDADKFKQVLINLITNAIKYTDQGSITIAAKRNKNDIMLSIKDTGSGIKEDAIPYIFDRFYQVEHHMVRKTGGVGLGLAIVKNICELHGAKIKVESKIGSGTTFLITLPRLEKQLAKQNNAIA